MSILGTFTKAPDVWIEETRSMAVKPDEKTQILATLADPNE